MIFTLFRNLWHQRVPVVVAALRYQNRDVPAPLYFAVDTAAQQSVITPQCEAQIILAEPSVAWKQLFTHGKKVDTIQGEANFKSLTGNVGLTFLAEDNTTWSIDLPEMLFCDESRRGPSNIVAAKHLPFSILGQDVLRNCSILANDKHGIITPDTTVADRAIEALIKKLKKSP